MEWTKGNVKAQEPGSRDGRDQCETICGVQGRESRQDAQPGEDGRAAIEIPAHSVPGVIPASDGWRLQEPHVSYKVAFLIGGMAFALVTYLVGTLLYEAESRLFGSEQALDLGIGSSVQRIFPDHLLTLTPWVLGTTGLFIVLGYLFDKQVRFRRLAEALRARAEALAVTDSLTLAYNHGYLMQQVSLEVDRAERPFGARFAILFIDIDDFKMYNDAHGHLAGDDVLRSLVMVVKQTVRSTDLVARYGGEELVVLSPGATKEGAVMLAERIRSSVALHCPVTVSIGVAVFPDDGSTPDALLARADTAMYRAKTAGKNSVCAAA